MNRLLRRTVAALVFLSVGAVTMAQTCRDDIPATAPNERFTDNGDGTVTDLATGLIWKQCAEGLSGAGCASGSAATLTWQQALQHAADSGGWRLPNKNELASLVERRCYEPAINETLFPNTPFASLTGFWSSSPIAYDSWRAWYVYFTGGRVGYNDKNHALSVRLVRGGQ